jgi:hypothetical protein
VAGGMVGGEAGEGRPTLGICLFTQVEKEKEKEKEKGKRKEERESERMITLG